MSSRSYLINNVDNKTPYYSASAGHHSPTSNKTFSNIISSSNNNNSNNTPSKLPSPPLSASDSVNSYPAAFLGSTPPPCHQDLSSHFHAEMNHSESDTMSNHSSSNCSTCALAASSSLNSNKSTGNFVPVFSDMGALYPRHTVGSQGNVPWRCFTCGSKSFGHRCYHCNSTRDNAALRVFVGQLSREGVAEIVPAMVNALAGAELSAPILHVEPHTAKNGTGKGCCWLFVDCVEDMNLIVRRLNKRTFVTIHEVTGEVGFKTFPGNFSESQIHNACMAELSTLTHGARELLHYTSAVVAEVPKVLANALSRRAPTAAPRYVPAPYPNASIAMPPSLDAVSAAPPVYTTPAPAAPMSRRASPSSAAATEKESENNNKGRLYMWNPYTGAKIFVKKQTS